MLLHSHWAMLEKPLSHITCDSIVVHPSLVIDCRQLIKEYSNSPKFTHKLASLLRHIFDTCLNKYIYIVLYRNCGLGLPYFIQIQQASQHVWQPTLYKPKAVLENLSSHHLTLPHLVPWYPHRDSAPSFPLVARYYLHFWIIPLVLPWSCSAWITLNSIHCLWQFKHASIGIKAVCRDCGATANHQLIQTTVIIATPFSLNHLESGVGCIPQELASSPPA